MATDTKTRSERWRDRRRAGLMPVTINVAPAHRRALEAMGLIATSADRDKDAVASAVQRFLDTAPAVNAIGGALYPDGEETAAVPRNAVP